MAKFVCPICKIKTEVECLERVLIISSGEFDENGEFEATLVDHDWDCCDLVNYYCTECKTHFIKPLELENING